MISKQNRLSEREVKKVLNKGKPFFSYGIVLNYMKNNTAKNRYAIVIGAKSVKTNVERVFFRRTYYDIVSKNLINLPFSKGVPEEGGGGIRKNIANKGIDFVFVVKKQTKLDKIKKESILTFKKDIKFLLNKI